MTPNQRAIEEELVRLVETGGDQYPLTESRYRILRVDLDGEWPETKIRIHCQDRLRGGTEVFEYVLWGDTAEYRLDVETPVTASALILADVADS